MTWEEASIVWTAAALKQNDAYTMERPLVLGTAGKGSSLSDRSLDGTRPESKNWLGVKSV